MTSSFLPYSFSFTSWNIWPKVYLCLTSAWINFKSKFQVFILHLKLQCLVQKLYKENVFGHFHIIFYCILCMMGRSQEHIKSTFYFTEHVSISLIFLPTASVMTLSFSRITFTTRLFCNGVTLQQSTARQCFTRATKRSSRSGDKALSRVRPSITRDMFWVVSTLRGSALYLLTSSRVQSRMFVHVIWKTAANHLDDFCFEVCQTWAIYYRKIKLLFLFC